MNGKRFTDKVNHVDVYSQPIPFNASDFKINGIIKGHYFGGIFHLIGPSSQPEICSSLTSLLSGYSPSNVRLIDRYWLCQSQFYLGQYAQIHICSSWVYSTGLLTRTVNLFKLSRSTPLVVCSTDTVACTNRFHLSL